MVRGEPRGLRVWPGAQSPPGGGAGRSACRGEASLCHLGPAGARVPRLLVLHDRQLEPTRRVVGKAEHTLEGANPRFIVTSLRRSRVGYDARALYEKLYCARGEAENRIGEQFELFADRASSATMQANQLRMSFSAMAYVLVDTLRRVGLRHSQFADAAVATIRLKLLKLGAQVRTSVRRIHFAIASGCPNKDEFELAHISFSVPSAPPESHDAANTPGLLIAVLKRALMDSHYGRSKVTARARREPRQIAAQPDARHHRIAR